MSRRSEEAHVVVLGAGPVGLAVALHLLAADPSGRDAIRVIDPSGGWLTAWRDRFRRLEIDRLRSPAVHHPGPDPGALLRWMAERGATGSGPYRSPDTATFESFCDRLVADAGLTDAVRAEQVHEVQPAGRGLRVLTSATAVRARAVVLATNPHRRTLPDWLAAVVPVALHRLRHADDIDLTAGDGDLSGEHVAIIGGGLTAAHLACGVAGHGGTATIIARRALTERNFDVEPGWLGPRRLDAFHAEPDPDRRLQQARSARGGGSIPPGMLTALRGLEAAGALRIVDGAEVRAAEQRGPRFRLDAGHGGPVLADRIWLATGTEACLSAARCLHGLAADIPMGGELPLPDGQLRLGPWPLFATGRLATSRLGPAAGNLWGARQAALAITRALTGVDLEHPASVR